MKDTFTYQVALPDRRHEIIYVLAYETAKRLGYFIEDMTSVAISCRHYQAETNRNIYITLRPEYKNLVWHCQLETSATAAVQASTLFDTFEKKLEALQEIADEELLLMEYNALKQQFSDTMLVTPPPAAPVPQDLLLFKHGFRITPAIIIINVAVYLLMVVSGVNWIAPDAGSLITWGGNLRAVTLEGEWWRIFSAGFLHIGLIHLAMNMFALVQIGTVLEPLIGARRFVIAYFTALVSGSLLSLAWHDNVVSAGASGAVFGMYGVFLALLTTKLITKSVRQSLLAGVLTFVGYNLVFGLQGGIDNAGHVGGLLGGMLAGYAMVPAIRRNEDTLQGLVLPGAAALFMIVLIPVVFAVLPNDFGVYEKKMKEFSRLEEKALSIYSQPEGTPDSVTAMKLQQMVIPAWDSCRMLTREIDQLDLPQAVLDRNKLVTRYCEYRQHHTALAFRYFANRDSTVLPDLELVNFKLDSLVGALNPGGDKK